MRLLCFRAGGGRLLGLAISLFSIPACLADPAPVIHYAPVENLEHSDVALIDQAEHNIDIAAYVLTDWPVMQALIRAAQRGVKIRIYMDGGRIGEREPKPVFRELIATPEIEVRFKAANFSASGLKRQDKRPSNYREPSRSNVVRAAIRCDLRGRGGLAASCRGATPLE
jgi:PLD-like domain